MLSEKGDRFTDAGQIVFAKLNRDHFLINTLMTNCYACNLANGTENLIGELIPLVVSEVEIFCEKARTAFSTVKF
ncbi:hypothetical protein C7B62_22480 [Pleurocapsa sp. CCALA 161]|uniref:hypothetical protein n=1 Tax=Pleurocapsa sp. CCALA 161 TaxID=2107688 RepID=UPI000D066449|nr:hypothetical protein [Pleurocapsa sp. CCALA 161]PSB06578.1 hypothetical protein C7B62_22480 [Pleurocapsa sp. CCALA 161]